MQPALRAAEPRRSGSRVARKWLIGLTVYFVFSVATLVFPSPFRALVAEACEIGEWEPHQVTFRGGRYG